MCYHSYIFNILFPQIGFKKIKKKKKKKQNISNFMISLIIDYNISSISLSVYLSILTISISL